MLTERQPDALFETQFSPSTLKREAFILDSLIVEAVFEKLSFNEKKQKNPQSEQNERNVRVR